VVAVSVAAEGAADGWIGRCVMASVPARKLHHKATTRTTLAIDDDVLSAAKHLAERQNKSIGEVISALARQGLSRGSRKGKAERNGIPLLRAGTTPVTMELVNQLRGELP
jgi:hypothetical protein